MKKLVLAFGFGILASGIIVFVLGLQANNEDRFDEIVRQIQEKEKQEQEQERRKIGAVGIDEWERGARKCLIEKDRNACQALIDGGVASVEQCGYYNLISDYRKAMSYYEKAIDLGDNREADGYLANVYLDLQDYYNAKKFYEIACNKGNGDLQAKSCYNLGLMYFKGKGVRQDYAKAAELSKKACDMKYGVACDNLGYLYYTGQGVKQNLSTAKQYAGKACDLGNQKGCDNYKGLHNQGVQ